MLSNQTTICTNAYCNTCMPLKHTSKLATIDIQTHTPVYIHAHRNTHTCHSVTHENFRQYTFKQPLGCNQNIPTNSNTTWTQIKYTTFLPICGISSIGSL